MAGAPLAGLDTRQDYQRQLVEAGQNALWLLVPKYKKPRLPFFDELWVFDRRQHDSMPHDLQPYPIYPLPPLYQLRKSPKLIRPLRLQ